MLKLTAPTKIVTASAISFLLVSATMMVSLDWLAHAMDDRAQADTVTLVESHLATAEETIESQTLDVSYWTLAYQRVREGNTEWLASNLGAAARQGAGFQRIVFVGGVFPDSIGWGQGGPSEPAQNWLDPAIVDMIRQPEGLTGQTPAGPLSFYVLEDGQPILFSVSRMFGSDEDIRSRFSSQDPVFVVMGRYLDEDRLAETRRMLLLNNLRFTVDPSDAAASVLLTGHNGEPIGYLAWEPALPGTAILQNMWPALVAAFVLSLSATVFASSGAYRLARNLVLRKAEAVSAARTDVLTQLPSRYALQEALDEADLNPDSPMGVLFVDLNNFKRINDAIGHTGGDSIVCDLANRLSSLMTSNMFLSRAGGDEFVVLVTDTNDVEAMLHHISEEVRDVMVPDFTYDGQPISVSVAQGFAFRLDGSISAPEVVRRADLAMYRAKQTRETIALAYGPEVETTSEEDRAIERALRHSLNYPEEFSVAYQPIINATSGQLVRAEALARWTSSQMGPVPPDKFIAIAEQSGMILTLSQLILEQICKDLVRFPELSISLNISPIQILSAGFAEEIISNLRAYGIDPSRVEIELTEGVIVTDPDLATFRLDLLKDYGFSTALDDFGTGYSSLGYLRQMPFDTLKIDRSFIRSGELSSKQSDLLKSVILLGHSLGQEIVCEGIETEEQANFLRQLGCDLFQGYLFAKPMPIDAFMRWHRLSEQRLDVG